MNSEPYIHKLILCSNVFIRKAGKYMLLKRSPNKKAAPNFIHPFGGKLDKDENPYIGATREVKEETGFDIKNLKLEAVVLEIKPDKEKPENWMIFYFSSDYDKGQLKKTEEGEIVFLTENELRMAHLFPSTKNIIENILNPGDGTVFTTNTYSGFESGLNEILKGVCAT
jgi:8-oxo-dGTP pyrophosphatase MutT (NUDIX family)